MILDSLNFQKWLNKNSKKIIKTLSTCFVFTEGLKKIQKKILELYELYYTDFKRHYIHISYFLSIVHYTLLYIYIDVYFHARNYAVAQHKILVS